ncbi:MAG: hypothetical protein KF745_07020 [Phycisphaeraceae bacterium]|nr:hypothetical protein [Phycisphaeraceae bacterium]
MQAQEPRSSHGPAPAARLKWRLVAGYWAVQAVVLYVGWPILTDFGWSDLVFSRGWLAWGGGSIAVITTLQALFLLPIRRPGLTSEGTWSVRTSLAIAGLAIAFMIMAILTTVTDIFFLSDIDQPLRDWGYLAAFGATLAMFWTIVTPLVFAFCRNRPRESALARLAALIFTGTVIEAASIIPVDVMVRRKSKCYCDQGTFWSLTICGVVGTFMLGPAVYLPLLARRRQRYYAGHCAVCGYDMSGCMTADRCPECGAGWRASRGDISTPPTPPRATAR